MIRVRHYGKGEWGVESDRYSPALRNAARGTPGLRWEPSARAWVGYIDAVEACASVMKAAGLRLDESEMAASPTTATTLPISFERSRDYQREAISFVVKEAPTGCLLALDMRLGKTHCALRAARATRAKTLVVCPSFVKGVWEEETKLWWPTAKVQTLEGVKPNGAALTADVIIVNYDIVHAWAERLLEAGIRVLILDEVHALQSEKSRRSKACKELAKACAWKIGLSGTPMLNRPKDLWNVIDTLSEGRMGGFFPYALRFCDAKREEVAKNKTVWLFDGSSNLEELNRRLSRFMFRRTRADVSSELPPRTRQVVDVDVGKKFRVEPSLALADNSSLRRALDLAADGKLPDVVDLVRSHVDDGVRCVVFTHRRAVAEDVCAKLVSEGVDAVFVHGELARKTREARIKSKARVLCATIDSTGVGIDLSMFDVAVFAELDWVPSKLAQAEARLFNFESKKDIFIQYVIARGTADDIIRKACITKLDAFEAAIGKTDDGLRKDLKGLEDGGAAALSRLYAKLMEAT